MRETCVRIAYYLLSGNIQRRNGKLAADIIIPCFVLMLSSATRWSALPKCISSHHPTTSVLKHQIPTT